MKGAGAHRSRQARGACPIPIAPWAAFAILAALSQSPARATCVQNDLPDCTCDFLAGEWPLSAVVGDVIATAMPTVGTTSSCLKHGGQPYWQVQLQVDDPVVAHLLAHLVGWLGGSGLPGRQAWCTETVAFWHREARVPYSRGYETFWHPSPFVDSARDLQEWYKTEELLDDIPLLPDGRGHWIDGTELDYADFIPGVNGPCPGAYQEWEAYNPVTRAWSGACLHSQVVDSVVIYRLGAVDGPIQKVDVRVVDGNIKTGSMNDVKGDTLVDQARIRSNKWYRDVIQYTALGSDATACNVTTLWKIRGWGIDEYSSGLSRCDPDKIETVVSLLIRGYPAPTGPDTTGNATTNQLVSYGTLLGQQGGPQVSSNSTLVQTGGALPSETSPWTIPPAPHPVDPVDIDVDLRAQHPYPMRGVTIEWKDGFAPRQFEVWWAGQNLQIHTRSVTMGTGAPPPPPGALLPMPVPFAPSPTYPVRYLKLRIPNTSLDRPFQITGLHPNFRTGTEDDNGEAADPGPGDAVAVGDLDGPRPDFELSAVIPNPSARGAMVEFRIPRGRSARLEVVDVSGRRIRDLGRHSGTGTRQRIFWDGLDDRGRGARSGVYLLVLLGEEGALRRTIAVVQ
jgi:hypothetical protein